MPAGLEVSDDPGMYKIAETFDHDAPDKQYDEARLNAPHIVETVLKALRVNSAGVEEVRAEGLGLQFDFDRAYWMSELTPADPIDLTRRTDQFVLGHSDGTTWESMDTTTA